MNCFFINKFKPSLSKEGLELYNNLINLYPHYINGELKVFNSTIPYPIEASEEAIEELVRHNYLTLKNKIYCFNEEGVTKRI